MKNRQKTTAENKPKKPSFYLPFKYESNKYETDNSLTIKYDLQEEFLGNVKKELNQENKPQNKNKCGYTQHFYVKFEHVSIKQLYNIKFTYLFINKHIYRLMYLCINMNVYVL